jgi:hypothetical protein
MQFSLYRVWLLCKKQWAENRQLYILGLLATAGIMGAAFLIPVTIAEGLDYGHQRAILFGGAGIIGAVFTSTILSQFNDKTKGIQALTLPASAAEKLVAAILYTLLIFPLAYLLVAYPVMMIIRYIDVDMVGHTNPLYDLSLNGRVSETVGLYVTLQAAVLLCSVLFKRYTIVKTIVLVFVVFYGSIVINPLIADGMMNIKALKDKRVNVRQIVYDEAGKAVKDTMTREIVAEPVMQTAGPYSDINMYYKNNFYKINFALDKPYIVNLVLSVNDTGKWIFHILFILMIPFLWLVTWFRLKETQL